MSKASRKISARAKNVHAFVDTNIFLDFYRSGNETSLNLLEKLELVRGRIISTYQVEMEFLKNRQAVVLDSFKREQLKLNTQLPAVIRQTFAGIQLAKSGRDVDNKTKNLSAQIERLLDQPSKSDPVFRSLNQLFASPLDHVLTRDMSIRHTIKRLAWRRFMLGYPPRKGGDTSIGDALNWEWILHCAKSLPGDIVIVSRDKDYGVPFNKGYFINDSLKKEYRERVGPRRKLILTHRLSSALEYLEVSISEKERLSEEAQINALAGQSILEL